jgi:ubiquinone/menaquinone biosynthesis C-methylase UbiE
MKKRSPRRAPRRTVKPRTTSWGKSAAWYDRHLEENADTYQAEVVAPNLMRVLALKPGLRVLDVACGQGFFTRKFAETGARVAGTDISPELIRQASARSPQIPFFAAPADRLPFAKDESVDIATIILAIQNIQNMGDVCAEMKRILVPGGRLVMVMNHPAFRIPKRSRWGWDETERAQYRRIDGYLSASEVAIEMHPGTAGGETTLTYHRSLQDMFKALAKAGFAVSKLEEWISHRTSEKGPRQDAEDRARKEIPLFLMLECRKM